MFGHRLATISHPVAVQVPAGAPQSPAFATQKTWGAMELEKCVKKYAVFRQFYIYTVMEYIYIYVCVCVTVCQKCIFLVWLINRNSLCAASYLVLKKKMTSLNSLVSNRQDKLQVLWRRVRHGSIEIVFCFFFGSALLAGKITYKFATLSRNLKYIGKLLSSTEIH